MKKLKHAIECGRCGEIRQEVLTEEEARTLSDATGPIYRQCEGCGKTTGWIGSARQPAASKEQASHSAQTPPAKERAADSRTLKGQERMATQAERDKVNSMVNDSAQDA